MIKTVATYRVLIRQTRKGKKEKMKRTVYEVWVKSYNDHVDEPMMIMVGKFYQKQAAELFEAAFKFEYGSKPAIFVTEEDKIVKTAHTHN